MKRLFFSVALLATLASCSKNEDVTTPQSNQIRLSTINDRVVSKAANDLTGDDAVDFKVFAEKGSKATAWYINDYVTGGASTATAPVDGPYYWPTDGSSMAFYAYAPYVDGGANNVTQGTGMNATSLSYVVPAGAQEDFTVASPVTCAGGDEAYPSTIDFTFKHMLAKVTVKVVLDDKFGKNNYISVNESTEPDPGTSYNDSDKPFTATFTALANALTVDATAETLKPTAAANNAETSMAYANNQMYYIAPQVFKGCKLQIKGITIRDKNTHSTMHSGDLNVITLDGTELNSTGATFDAGSHYILTVTVGADAAGQTEIKFTADNAAWDVEDNDADVDQVYL